MALSAIAPLASLDVIEIGLVKLPGPTIVLPTASFAITCTKVTDGAPSSSAVGSTLTTSEATTGSKVTATIVFTFGTIVCVFAPFESRFPAPFKPS